MRNFSSSITNPCGQMKMIETKSFLKGGSAPMVLAIAFLFLSLFPAAAKASASYNMNLVYNGDAEENNTEMAGWDASCEPTAFMVLMPVDSWVGPSIDGGNAFTYYPKAYANEYISQTIDISNLASDITSGMVCVYVSAKTRIKMPGSTGAIHLEMLDESGNVLATSLAGEIGYNNLLWKDLHIDRTLLDVRTRRLRIKLAAQISNNKPKEDLVQFDCVSLTLTKGMTSASVSGIVAPVTGGAAVWESGLTPGSSSYRVTSVAWQNEDGGPANMLYGISFMGNSTYRALIELTANAGFKFESGGLTPTVNTGTIRQKGTVSGGDVEGNKLTFAVYFPATATPKINGILIYTQPTVLSYIEGQALNLNGLELVLRYDDGYGYGGYTPGKFASSGITANPANGTIMRQSNHGQKIALSLNGFTAYTNAISIVPKTYTIAANPDSIQFDSVMQGYSSPPDAKTVTIKNTGSCPVTLIAPVSTDYVVGALSKISLNVGDNATFTIRPKPGMGAGTNSKTITVKTNQGTSASVNVTFPVIALTYTISFSKGSLDFGREAEGYAAAPAAQTITVTNTGNSPVTLTAPTSTNNMVGTLSKTVLSAGASATFTVQPKTGLGEGIYSETITVKTNHGTSNSVDVSFTVTKAPYAISASPATLDFYSLAKGYLQPESQTVTVTNTGSQSISLYQPTSAHYVIGTLSATALEPGDCADFTVVPKDGLYVGTYTDTLQITGSNGVKAQADVTFTCTESNVIDILSGVGGAYLQNGSGSSSMTIIADGDIDDFTGLTLNGDLVDESNYDVRRGSTIVTLHQDFLESLAPGTYTLRIHYTDGMAEAEFVVQDQMPATGDNNTLAVFGALTALCLIALIMIKRKQAAR